VTLLNLDMHEMKY